MAKGLKSLGDILLGIVSFGLSYWFYRGHLEQYVHYIAHYGFYFQVLLNIVIIVLLSYFIYAFLKLLLTRKLKKQTLLLLYLIYFVALFYLLFLKNIGLQGLSLPPFFRPRTVLGKPLCSRHEPTNVYSSRTPLPFTVK